MATTWQRLEQAFAVALESNDYEISVRIEGSSEVMWSGELRYTRKRQYPAVEQSVVFFALANQDPAQGIASCLNALDRFLGGGEDDDYEGSGEDEGGDCIPSKEGGFWTDPNDPTA